MSDEQVSIPTTLLFRPLVLLDGDEDCEQESTIAEQDAGRPSDLYVYNGRLTTLANEAEPIHLVSRSAKSAKQFFCPVCDAVIKVTAKDIYCGKCQWNATQAGIHSVAELLQREADPYPILTERFQQLVKIARGEVEAECAITDGEEPDSGYDPLFSDVRIDELTDKRVQVGRLFKKGEPPRRRLVSPAVEVLDGEAVSAELVLPKLQVDICGADAIVQMHNVRDEDVSVLVCAAGEDDGQALTLGTEVIGEARLHVAQEAIMYERDGGVVELDFWFCYESGEFASNQFGVRVFARFTKNEED
ncbi:hypothetical protein BWQ96_06190 [Gracilariopsis chorda]|uniref:Uncharacterized protein n=1 Tax=Gracilariopsis chorda TaxID=448386 RepID=A0A2V3IPX4_9FLOR|nr:hypothetical protein BWQ96_06190 [Gracilariopsis chorda]|eukprot:PXF44109.1 hypothetical protein BWQ96_06190 [Gracilariopsis chorda]